MAWQPMLWPMRTTEVMLLDSLKERFVFSQMCFDGRNARAKRNLLHDVIPNVEDHVSLAPRDGCAVQLNANQVSYKRLPRTLPSNVRC